MNAAIVIPTGITDSWREQARDFVTAWYGEHFPRVPIVFGQAPAGEWSKGAAVADAVAQTDADVFVLADADSFLTDPDVLRRALELVTATDVWVVPHRRVYRLRDIETARLHEELAAGRKPKPRLGWTVRPVYEGPAGGGISIVSRAAFERVRGIDARFLGWGGEDLCFGWALDTLHGRHERLDGNLVHLWHPHPAPKLRGSDASEKLVARYRVARGVPRRMAAVVAGEEWAPLPPLPRPIRFRMTANRKFLHLASGQTIRFENGIFETTDPDEVEQIRTFNIVREERIR